ncbi:hypothetical protein [Geobacter sp.]|uniref:hypothetical protein n=1 Tax=Geobacter sp. TaxID=46610 RepID=UPI00261D952A|nr:hypothetical protein [Geobacter sp.]
MVTILLIADQDRLERLFNFTGESPRIGFRISRSLRQGILDIAEAPPAFLFIQNHLSGLSGEIIARHLVAEIAGRRPLVTLFGEGNGCVPVPGVVDACLDISRPDEELVAAIIGLISNNADSAVESSSPSEPVNNAVAPPAAGAGETPPPSDARPKAPATEEPPPKKTEASPFDRTLQSALDDTAAPVSLAELEGPATLGLPSEGAAKPPGTSNGVLRSRGRARTRQLPLYLASAGILAAGVILFIILMPAPKPALSPKSAPANQGAGIATKPPAATASVTAAPPGSAPPAKINAPPTSAPMVEKKAPAALQKHSEPAPSRAVRGLATLPGFIPREGLDKKFGTSHPGWERYQGARTEFKIYRESTGIKAVQAIDRSGIGIPESFLRGAIAQMTRTRDFTIGEREIQGKFQVEKGTVASGARLVIYRTGPKGSIRAFVVYFQ